MPPLPAGCSAERFVRSPAGTTQRWPAARTPGPNATGDCRTERLVCGPQDWQPYPCRDRVVHSLEAGSDFSRRSQRHVDRVGAGVGQSPGAQPQQQGGLHKLKQVEMNVKSAGSENLDKGRENIASPAFGL